LSVIIIYIVLLVDGSTNESFDKYNKTSLMLDQK